MEEKLSKDLQTLNEKFTMAQGTLRTARKRMQSLTQDKEQVGNGVPSRYSSKFVKVNLDPFPTRGDKFPSGYN